MEGCAVSGWRLMFIKQGTEAGQFGEPAAKFRIL
jgi:hypothetical protein